MPRHPDPELEQRILAAASRLWARGGEKALTMRAVAKAAGTTTPTVYERYRDREDILRALRIQTRRELFAALSRTRTLREAFQAQLDFALKHSHAYKVLFDGWPNLLRCMNPGLRSISCASAWPNVWEELRGSIRGSCWRCGR